MTYDCFTFFNELELLELRLHELAGVVDKFVLVEATKTHTNRDKPLHYLESRARFSRFQDRIIHVIVDDLPRSSDAWASENFQRNCISRGLTQCRPEDWILVSDLDEIPRAVTVERTRKEYPFPRDFTTKLILRPVIRLLSTWNFSRGYGRRNNPFIFKFQQSLHRHFLNCVVIGPPASVQWCGTRMLYYRDFVTAQEVRHSGYKTVEDGGWHFTSMGGSDRIVEKIKSFAHQEFNQPEFIDPDRINQAIQNGKPLFGPMEKLQFAALDDSYPSYVLENREMFSAWVKPI